MLHCENVFVTLRCLCCKTCWWQSHVFVAKNIIVVDNVFVAKLVGDKVTSLLRKMSLLLNLLVTKSRLCCEKCLGCKTCCIAKNIIVVDNVFVAKNVFVVKLVALRKILLLWTMSLLVTKSRLCHQMMESISSLIIYLAILVRSTLSLKLFMLFRGVTATLTTILTFSNFKIFKSCYHNLAR